MGANFWYSDYCHFSSQITGVKFNRIPREIEWWKCTHQINLFGYKHDEAYKTEFFCIVHWVILFSLSKVDNSPSGGWEGTLLRSHTRTTPTRAPERCAMWLTARNELPTRNVPGKAVEAWAASITCRGQEHMIDQYGLMEYQKTLIKETQWKSKVYMWLKIWVQS